jgi:hypothetical protein
LVFSIFANASCRRSSEGRSALRQGTGQRLSRPPRQLDTDNPIVQTL